MLARFILGQGIRLAARWLRRLSDQTAAAARVETARELAQSKRDEADSLRRHSEWLLREAYRKRMLPDRRGVPRPLTALKGPYARMREAGLVDTSLFSRERVR